MFGMKMTVFSGRAIGSILIWSAVSASAAIETESFSYNYGSAASPITGGTVNQSYQEFDPSLGQLIGITLAVDSYNTAVSTIFSTGPGNAYADASVSQGSVTVTVGAPDLVLGLTTTSLSAGPFAGITGGFLTKAGSGISQYNTTSGTVPSSDFSSYIGTGMQALTLTVDPGTAYFSGTGGSSVGFGGQLNAYGTVEVEYMYLAIPEAGYFSLFAGSIAGLVALRGCFRALRGSNI